MSKLHDVGRLTSRILLIYFIGGCCIASDSLYYDTSSASGSTEKPYVESMSQQELLDYYNSQKKLKDLETANKKKEDAIELERLAKEERERQERESKSNLEERGQQIGKEANRVVNQTKNEVKRFVKRF